MQRREGVASKNKGDGQASVFYSQTTRERERERERQRAIKFSMPRNIPPLQGCFSFLLGLGFLSLGPVSWERLSQYCTYGLVPIWHFVYPPMLLCVLGMATLANRYLIPLSVTPHPPPPLARGRTDPNEKASQGPCIFSRAHPPIPFHRLSTTGSSACRWVARL